MKRLMASWWVMVSGVATVASSGRLSGGTMMTSSPLRPSSRRLVSRNLRFGQVARSPSTRSPTGDTRCSQLSSTRSAVRSAM